MPYCKVDCNVMKRVGGACLHGLDKMELLDDLQGRRIMTVSLTIPYLSGEKGLVKLCHSQIPGNVSWHGCGFKTLLTKHRRI